MRPARPSSPAPWAARYGTTSAARHTEKQEQCNNKKTSSNYNHDRRGLFLKRGMQLCSVVAQVRLEQMHLCCHWKCHTQRMRGGMPKSIYCGFICDISTQRTHFKWKTILCSTLTLTDLCCLCPSVIIPVCPVLNYCLQDICRKRRNCIRLVDEGHWINFLEMWTELLMGLRELEGLNCFIKLLVICI